MKCLFLFTNSKMYDKVLTARHKAFLFLRINEYNNEI